MAELSGFGSDLSFLTGQQCIEVFRRTLYQPYRVHLARNSSAVLGGIYKVSVIQSVVQGLLTVVSSTVLIVSIMIALLAVNSEVAIAAALGFGISYGVIVRISSWRLERNSHRVAVESTQMIKVLQEGLGGIRDVLLDGTQKLYCNVYRNSILPATRAQVSNQFLSASPRYLMESLGLVLIACLAYYLSLQDGGVAGAMPVLGSLAFGAQRMLPAIQQLYSGWVGIAGNQASLGDALELLDQPLPDGAIEEIPEPLSFDQSICFEQVRFRYSDVAPWVLDGIDLVFNKGDRVGIVGDTGSGKSTMLDLLMGLLDPTEGEILLDGKPIRGEYRRRWQRIIAHVPQSIFLADATLSENIAFGVAPEDIDMGRVREAAREAQLAEFIESRPEGYQAIVGERGVRLSGGQRQRIGIARALYKQADVIVFDEATSALDTETEQAVMDSIESLSSDITLFIIAHRLTTLKNCSRIVELRSGGIQRIGTYQSIVLQPAASKPT